MLVIRTSASRAVTPELVSVITWSKGAPRSCSVFLGAAVIFSPFINEWEDTAITIYRSFATSTWENKMRLVNGIEDIICPCVDTNFIFSCIQKWTCNILFVI